MPLIGSLSAVPGLRRPFEILHGHTREFGQLCRKRDSSAPGSSRFPLPLHVENLGYLKNWRHCAGTGSEPDNRNEIACAAMDFGQHQAGNGSKRRRHDRQPTRLPLPARESGAVHKRDRLFREGADQIAMGGNNQDAFNALAGQILERRDLRFGERVREIDNDHSLAVPGVFIRCRCSGSVGPHITPSPVSNELPGRSPTAAIVAAACDDPGADLNPSGAPRGRAAPRISPAASAFSNSSYS